MKLRIKHSDYDRQTRRKMMPCYDSQGADDERKMKKSLDLATRLLCELYSKLNEKRRAELSNPELHKWWKEHQILDEKRG